MKVAQSERVMFFSPCRSETMAMMVVQNAVMPVAQAPGPAPEATWMANAIHVSNVQITHENTWGLVRF